MAAYTQSGTMFGTMNQYLQYAAGAGMTYDSVQGKWVQSTNTDAQGQNQANQSVMQNQAAFQNQDYYSALANSSLAYNYNQSSGSYGQQDYSTGAFDSSVNMGTNITNASTTDSSTKAFVGGTSGTVYGTGSITGQSFGPGMSFGNNTVGQKGAKGTVGQSFGSSTTAQSFGNGSNNNTTQGFGNNSTTQNWGGIMAQALGENMGQDLGNSNGMAGGTLGNVGTNPGTFGVLDNGLMGIIGASLFQNTAYSGNMAMDSEGVYYAAPTDSAYQTYDGYNQKKSARGKHWSGKDAKQDFYGGRFSGQNVFGQWGGGQGKQKQLMQGVRFNANNEKVVDVELPLSLFSRWRQLRKFHGKQDTEVIRHLFEVHDMLCKACPEREDQKKQVRLRGGRKDSENGRNPETEQGAEAEVDEEEMTEEEREMRRIMGFSNFNTTKGAMLEANLASTKESGPGKTATTDGAATSGTETGISDQSATDTTMSFIGPLKPAENPNNTEDEAGLTEEERQLMKKLGWCVFNKKKGVSEDGKGDDAGDDDKIQTASSVGGEVSGEWKVPSETS